MTSGWPGAPKVESADGENSVSRRSELALGGYHSQGSELAAPATVEIPGAKSSELLLRALVAFRRAWPWLVVIGLITGGGVAFVSWKYSHAMFRSAGLVRIAYTLPPVLQVTDQNQPMQMFGTFMQSQQMLISSRRVTDMAMEDPVWRTTGHAVPVDPNSYFASNLEVSIKPGSEYIEISVTDPDPATAAAAVNSVINAYVELYNGQSQQLERERIGVLEESQKNLKDDIENLNGQINAGIAKYGTSDLQDFYEDAVGRLNKIETAIDDTKSAIAVAPTHGVAGNPFVSPDSGSSGDLTDDQIAASDGTMRKYLDERDRLNEELRRLKFLGYDQQHPQVVLDQYQLNRVMAEIHQYGQQVRVFQSATGAGFTDASHAAAGPLAATQKSVTDLRTDLANLTAIYEETKSDMLSIGADRKKFEDFNHQLSSDEEQLDALNKRMETLKTEDALGGRLSVDSTGEIPISPEKDRRAIYAVAGGLGGALAPTVILLLTVMLTSRKYLYSEETEAGVQLSAPLLGIVPVLGAHPLNSDGMIDAAHAVHQIRVRLRSQSAQDASSVYMVTSATSGDGKTSLTMALAISCAAARLRTLVIDCDLSACQLTRSLKADDVPGLQDALIGHTVKNPAKKIAPYLFVLPVGKTSMSATSLPTAAIRVLIKAAKREFDLVLFDTGPILSSVEAAVLAQEVEGIIFAISRGQHRSIVRRAVRRLDALGGKIEGFIFNRAQATDFLETSYGSSSHRSSRASTPRSGNHNGNGNGNGHSLMPRLDSETFSEFGPLVQAVACDWQQAN
jgi:polysaccharide biosynthesis transport protein